MATLGRVETGENDRSMFAVETNGRDRYLQNFGSHSQECKAFHPKILHSSVSPSEQ